MKNKTLKHYKKVLLPVMLALLTRPGCVQTVTLVVYNNSGKDVCVTALSEKYDLKSQTCIKILTAAGSSAKMLISDSSQKGYTAVLAIPQIRTIHENLYLQIEEDMKIYRVHNDKFPHNPLPEQTEGFPVDLAGGKQ